MPTKQDSIVTAPISGVMTDLQTVDDPVFASGSMGDGIAIMPSDGQIKAPINGTVAVVYPTAHAYGLVGEDGVEILIHIGIDTVSLAGKGFTSMVTQGQPVQVGDILGQVDLNVVQHAGYDPHVMVLVTNSAEYSGVHGLMPVNQTVMAGQSVLAVTPKGE